MSKIKKPTYEGVAFESPVLMTSQGPIVQHIQAPNPLTVRDLMKLLDKFSLNSPVFFGDPAQGHEPKAVEKVFFRGKITINNFHIEGAVVLN